jgi:drug/metabolite transporter (DMT)-like permease
MSLSVESRPAAFTNFAAAAMPLTFVFLWSTGFIAAKLALPHTGPLTLVALRFLIAAALLIPLVILWRAPWPASWRDVGHIAVTGVLVNCLALGGGAFALSLGLPTAIAALIGGLQPMLTGVLAGPALGEKVSNRQWLGLGLGFAGLVLVLSDKLSLQYAPPLAIVGAFAALIGMTVATLYQKRFCANMPLRSGAAIQFTAASAIMLPIAILAEGLAVEWTPVFALTLGWLAGGLSLGALTLFWILVRRGAAAKVSSLFYLTPPVTAVMGWLTFNERLGLLALIGMIVVSAGVILATRQATRPAD